MKTVKELENELKISKVSIYNMLKKDEMKPYIFKGADNITLINDVGEKLLKARYLQEQNETVKNIIADEINTNSKTDFIGTYSSKDIDVIKVLQEQLDKNTETIKVLQRQMEAKDIQINNLFNIITILNQQKCSLNRQTTKSDDKKTSKGFFKRIKK